jgi:hypothetical protein
LPWPSFSRNCNFLFSMTVSFDDLLRISIICNILPDSAERNKWIAKVGGDAELWIATRFSKRTFWKERAQKQARKFKYQIFKWKLARHRTRLLLRLKRKVLLPVIFMHLLSLVLLNPNSFLSGASEKARAKKVVWPKQLFWVAWFEVLHVTIFFLHVTKLFCTYKSLFARAEIPLFCYKT